MVLNTVSKTAPSVQPQTAPSNLPVFAHAGLGSVRVYVNDGEPWFVARDVCECLGFDNAHTNMALSGLDDDEITTSNKVVGRRNLNGLRKDSSLVSESGMYSLIFRSHRPEAKAFRRWVTHEVLPSIRKTGRYSVEPAQLLPYQVIRTLPKSAKDRLNDLVNTKLAHVPTAFGWKTRMRIWKQFNKAFRITRYELLPEARMTEAITFLTGLDVGHGGAVTCKTGLLPLPVNTAQTTAASLAALIEQGQTVLASLSAHTA